MRARLEIDSTDPTLLKKSLEPDIRNTDRVSISMKVSGKKLVMDFEAKDFNALRASVTTIFRLVKAALFALEVKR